MVASVHLHCWLKALADFSQAENFLGEAKETLSQITEKTSQAICSFQKGLVALKVVYHSTYCSQKNEHVVRIIFLSLE